MSKPEGLFFIREIAAACGISINALRFYEAKALIQPAYTDPESGYRYYSRENLLRLRTILGLKKAGLSLPEVKEYLDGVRHTEKKISELTERREFLNRAIDNLRIRATQYGDLTVHRIELPERLCLCRTITASDAASAVSAIGAFYDEIVHKGICISTSWPEFCEYPDNDLLKGKFKITDFTITACMPIDEKSVQSDTVLYPSGYAAAVSYKGSYLELWKAYEALRQYMQKHQYSPSGYPQEIYFEIGKNHSVCLDYENNITQVIIPIKTKKSVSPHKTE